MSNLVPNTVINERREPMQETTKESRCVVCGGPLTPPATKCCSPECRRIRNLELTCENKRKRKERHQICPNCGKHFESSIDHRKYCSEQCAKEGRKATQQKSRDRPFSEFTAGLILGLYKERNDIGYSHRGAVRGVAEDLGRSEKSVEAVLRKGYSGETNICKEGE